MKAALQAKHEQAGEKLQYLFIYFIPKGVMGWMIVRLTKT